MDWDIIFERRTLFIMITTGLAVSALVFTPLGGMFPFWIILRGLYEADVLFHELGHTVWDWVFGMPAIPAILTLFGSDQAGGVTLIFDRNWMVQYAAFGALAYGCYRVKRRYPSYLWCAIGATLAIAAVAYTRYYRIPGLYMGPGGSIFMGGYFLFRAWKYRFARDAGERWLNAFFGFFLVFHNLRIALKLATDELFREAYASPTFGGTIDNDFVQMGDIVWHWSLHGIALFTIAYCALALLVPPLLACYVREEEEEEDSL